MLDVKSEGNGYDPAIWLVVRGREGLGEGQQVKLSLGETIVCGRSRYCDWSLRRAPLYLKAERPGRRELEDGLEFKSVSRRHVQIAFVAPDAVEVRNLSVNGTFVDGHRVDRLLLADCRERAHAIRLGPNGVQLELVPGSLPL